MPWSEWKLDVRPAEWRRLRLLVLEAAGWRCSLCREALHPKQCKPACDLDAQVDHVIPLADGGTSAAANLRAVCRGCNQRKADGLGPAQPTVSTSVGTPSRVW